MQPGTGNQGHANLWLCTTENHARQQHQRYASPVFLHKIERKISLDRKPSAIETAVEVLVWNAAEWSVLLCYSSVPLKYSAEVTAYLAYGEGHTCLQ